MPRINYSNIEATLGAPFLGTGTFSVTISGTTARGSSCLTGRFNFVKATQDSFSVVDRIQIIPEEITTYDYDPSVIFPSLPFSTPNYFTLRNKVSFGVNGILYNSVTAMSSFNATISSTVVQSSTAHTAMFNRLVLTSMPRPDRTRYTGNSVYKYSDPAAFFGINNHRMYMDY